MRTFKYFSLIALSLTVLWSCSDDDDAAPPPVNEEEVITTVIVTFIDGTNNSVIATYTDLDGDGPGEAVTVVQGTLEAGTAYTGSVRFLNATEDPPEDITLEVEEEDDEHQVFFLPAGSLNVNFDYDNFDGNDNPLGTAFTATAVSASTGNLRIVLRHEPNKPNDGTLADAGGETDIDVTFEIEVE